MDDIELLLSKDPFDHLKSVKVREQFPKAEPGVRNKSAEKSHWGYQLVKGRYQIGGGFGG
jgi:hypothetical protein